MIRRGHRKPRVPKPPKEAKPERPSTKELREAFKRLLTPDIGQRIDALVRALQWYDTAFNYVFLHKQAGAVTPEQEKAITIAGKCRMLGLSSGFNAEKENSYFKAVRYYEKALGPALKAPSITKFADILKAQEGKLQERQFRLERKFGTVLGVLQAALKPFNAEGGEVTLKAGQIQDPYKMDPELSQVSFRKDVIHVMRKKLRREGLLPVVLDVIDPLSSLAALEPVLDSEGARTGGYTVRASKKIPAMEKLLHNLVAFCKTGDAPKRLVRPPRLPAPSDGQPQKERKGGFGAGRAMVDGLFVEGSKRAVMYSVLRDQQTHTMEELAKLVYPESAKSVLFRVERRGIKSGRYTIIQNGENVNLQFNQTAQP